MACLEGWQVGEAVARGSFSGCRRVIREPREPERSASCQLARTRVLPDPHRLNPERTKKNDPRSKRNAVLSIRPVILKHAAIKNVPSNECLNFFVLQKVSAFDDANGWKGIRIHSGYEANLHVVLVAQGRFAGLRRRGSDCDFSDWLYPKVCEHARHECSRKGTRIDLGSDGDRFRNRLPASGQSLPIKLADPNQNGDDRPVRCHVAADQGHRVTRREKYCGFSNGTISLARKVLNFS